MGYCLQVYTGDILLIYRNCCLFSTVRLWDVNNDYKHKNVIKPKSQVGRKTIPTACTFSKDGNFVAAACQDGSIQMWDHRKNYVRKLKYFVPLFVQVLM